MNDADELARRYFALWAEYLTALVADPQAAEMLQRWIAFTGQFAKASAKTTANTAGQSGDERAGGPFPLWPPIPAVAATAKRSAPDGPAAAAATVAGASGERGAAVDELARRIGELERRLAAVEHKRQRGSATRRPRRRNPANGE